MLSVVMLSVVMLSVVMLSVVILSVVMLSVIMLSVIMLSVIMLNVIMLNVVMLSVIMLSVLMLSVLMLKVVMLSVVMLSVVMLSVIMLSVVMLSVVMLSVVAPMVRALPQVGATKAAPGKTYRRGWLRTVDLLVQTTLDPLLFILEILIFFHTKQATLKRRLTVLSLPFQLVFPGCSSQDVTSPKPFPDRMYYFRKKKISLLL